MVHYDILNINEFYEWFTYFGYFLSMDIKTGANIRMFYVNPKFTDLWTILFSYKTQKELPDFFPKFQG